MKTLILLATILLMFSITTHAQRIGISAIIERNVAGIEYGSSVFYESKKHYGLGGFYQVGLSPTNAEQRSSQTFCGILVNVPIASSDRINFFFQAKGGLRDNKYVVITPGIETEIVIVKHVWVAFGTNIRMTYPSMTAKLTYKF